MDYKGSEAEIFERLATLMEMENKAEGGARTNGRGRKGNPIPLAPLTADQALALALRVKPEDLKRAEQAEK